MAKGSGFGLVLRSHRERGGYSRRELAEAAGVSEGAVRDYELGKRSPSFDAVCRLAVALGESAAAFAGGADTAGAYRLPPRPDRLRCSTLTFGRHKGQRLDEVPGDYLEWLQRERPRRLQPEQLREIGRVLRERGRARAAAEERLARKDPPARQDKDAGKASRADRAPRWAAESDPVLARALEEKRRKPPPLVLDPEYFGGSATSSQDRPTPA